MHRAHGGVQGELLLVCLLGLPCSSIHGGEFQSSLFEWAEFILTFAVLVLVLLCEVCPHLDGRLQVSCLGGDSWLHDLLLLHALGSW